MIGAVTCQRIKIGGLAKKETIESMAARMARLQFS